MSCTEQDKRVGDHALGNGKADAAAMAPGGAGGRVRFIECNRQNDQKAVQDLLAALRTRRDSRGAGVFAFIHMDITHQPWKVFDDGPPFGQRPTDRCDHATYRTDKLTGELIDGLKKLGMWDETIFILTADHGELPTGGGGFPWHVRTRIPMVVRLPGVPGREIRTLAGSFDLGATVVDIFDPAALASMEGRSLWPVILNQQDWPDRVLFGLHAFEDCYYLVTAGGMQYIHHRGSRYEHLFNWRTDGANSQDLLRSDRAATSLARRTMKWFLDEHGRGRNYNDPQFRRADDGPDERPENFPEPKPPHRSGTDQIPN